MNKLIIVTLMMLSVSLPAVSAEPPSVKTNNLTSSENFNKNLSMVGAGLLGLVLASGAAGLMSTTSMMYEGAALSEAIEAGAGLSLPVAMLSAVLGGVFGQEFVQRNINSFNISTEPTH